MTGEIAVFAVVAILIAAAAISGFEILGAFPDRNRERQKERIRNANLGMRALREAAEIVEACRKTRS